MRSKNVLITGGSKRLGAYMVKHLRQLGHHVIFTYNTTYSEDKDAYHLDLSNPLEINNFWESLKAPVDVLINNSAHFQKDDLSSISCDVFEKNININLTAPILMCQKFAMQTNNGVIINILDKWAQTNPKNFLSYALSKNALKLFTHYLAEHWSPKIRSHGIELGFALYNEKFPLDFFNSNKDLYPTSLKQIVSILDFLISSDKLANTIIDAGEWK